MRTLKTMLSSFLINFFLALTFVLSVNAQGQSIEERINALSPERLEKIRGIHHRHLKKGTTFEYTLQLELSNREQVSLNSKELALLVSRLADTDNSLYSRDFKRVLASLNAVNFSLYGQSGVTPIEYSTFKIQAPEVEDPNDIENLVDLTPHQMPTKDNAKIPADLGFNQYTLITSTALSPNSPANGEEIVSLSIAQTQAQEIKQRLQSKFQEITPDSINWQEQLSHWEKTSMHTIEQWVQKQKNEMKSVQKEISDNEQIFAKVQYNQAAFADTPYYSKESPAYRKLVDATIQLRDAAMQAGQEYLQQKVKNYQEKVVEIKDGLEAAQIHLDQEAEKLKQSATAQKNDLIFSKKYLSLSQAFDQEYEGRKKSYQIAQESTKKDLSLEHVATPEKVIQLIKSTKKDLNEVLGVLQGHDQRLSDLSSNLEERRQALLDPESPHYIKSLSPELQAKALALSKNAQRQQRGLNQALEGVQHSPSEGLDIFLMGQQLNQAIETAEALRLDLFDTLSKKLDAASAAKLNKKETTPVSEDDYRKLSQLDASIASLKKFMAELPLKKAGSYAPQLDLLQKEAQKKSNIHFSKTLKNKEKVLNSIEERITLAQELLYGKKNHSGELVASGLQQLYQERDELIKTIQEGAEDRSQSHLRVPKALKWDSQQELDFIRGPRVRPALENLVHAPDPLNPAQNKSLWVPAIDAETALSQLKTIEKNIENIHATLDTELTEKQKEDLETNQAIPSLSESNAEEYDSFKLALTKINGLQEEKTKKVNSYLSSLIDSSSQSLEDYYQISGAKMLLEDLIRQRQNKVRNIFEMRNIALGKPPSENSHLNSDFVSEISGAFNEMGYLDTDELKESFQARLEGDKKVVHLAPSKTKLLAFEQKMGDELSQLVKLDANIQALTNSLGAQGQASQLTSRDYSNNIAFQNSRTERFLFQSREKADRIRDLTGLNADTSFSAHTPTLLVNDIIAHSKANVVDRSLAKNNERLENFNQEREQLHQVNQEQLSQYRDRMEERGFYHDSIRELNGIQNDLNMARVVAQRAAKPKGELTALLKMENYFKKINALKIEKQWLEKKLLELERIQAPESEINAIALRLGTVESQMKESASPQEEIQWLESKLSTLQQQKAPEGKIKKLQEQLYLLKSSSRIQAPYPIDENLPDDYQGDPRLNPHEFVAQKVKAFLISENKYYNPSSPQPGKRNLASLEYELQRGLLKKASLITQEELKNLKAEQSEKLKRGEKIAKEELIDESDFKYLDYIRQEVDQEIASLQEKITHQKKESNNSKISLTPIKKSIERDEQLDTAALGSSEARQSRNAKEQELEVHFEYLRNAVEDWDYEMGRQKILKEMESTTSDLLHYMDARGELAKGARSKRIQKLATENKLDAMVNSHIRKLNEQIISFGLHKAPYSIKLIDELVHPGEAPFWNFDTVRDGIGPKDRFFTSWNSQVDAKIQEIEELNSLLKTEISKFEGDFDYNIALASPMLEPIEAIYSIAMKNGWVHGDPRNKEAPENDEISEKMATNQKELENLHQNLTRLNSELEATDEDLGLLLGVQNSIENIEVDHGQHTPNQPGRSSEALRDYYSTLSESYQQSHSSLFDPTEQQSLQEQINLEVPNAAIDKELFSPQLPVDSFKESIQISAKLRPSFEENDPKNANTVQTQSDELKKQVSKAEDDWMGSGRNFTRLHQSSSKGIASQGRFPQRSTDRNACDVQELQTDVTSRYVYNRYFETIVVHNQRRVVDAALLRLRPLFLKLEHLKSLRQSDPSAVSTQQISFLIDNIKEEWAAIDHGLEDVEKYSSNILKQSHSLNPIYVLYDDKDKREALESRTGKDFEMQARVLNKDQLYSIHTLARDSKNFRVFGKQVLKQLDEIEAMNLAGDSSWENPLETTEDSHDKRNFDQRLIALKDDFSAALSPKQSAFSVTHADYPQWLPGEVARRSREKYDEGDKYTNSSKGAFMLQQAEEKMSGARTQHERMQSGLLSKYQQHLETWVLLDTFKKLQQTSLEWGLELAQSDAQQSAENQEKIAKLERLNQYKAKRFNEIQIELLKEDALQSAQDAWEAQQKELQENFSRELAEQAPEVANPEALVEIPFDPSSVEFDEQKAQNDLISDPLVQHSVYDRAVDKLFGNLEKDIDPDPLFQQETEKVLSEIGDLSAKNTDESFDLKKLPLATTLNPSEQSRRSVLDFYSAQNLQQLSLNSNPSQSSKEILHLMNQEDPNTPQQLIQSPQVAFANIESPNLKTLLPVQALLSAHQHNKGLPPQASTLKTKQFLELNQMAENIRLELLSRLPESQHQALENFSPEKSVEDLGNSSEIAQNRIQALEKVEQNLRTEFQAIVQKSQLSHNKVSTLRNEYKKESVGNNPFQKFYPDSLAEKQSKGENPLAAIKQKHRHCSHELIYKTFCNSKLTHAMMLYDGAYHNEDQDIQFTQWLSPESLELNEKLNALKPLAPQESREELLAFIKEHLIQWGQDENGYYRVAGRNCQDWKEILHRESLVEESDTLDELHNRAKTFNSRAARDAVNDLHLAPTNDLSKSSIQAFYNKRRVFAGLRQTGKVNEDGKVIKEPRAAPGNVIRLFDKAQAAIDGRSTEDLSKLRPFIEFLKKHPEKKPERGDPDALFTVKNGKVTEDIFSSFYKFRTEQCAYTKFHTYSSPEDQTTDYMDCIEQARAELDYLILQAFGDRSQGMDITLKEFRQAVQGSMGACSDIVGGAVSKEDILNPFAFNSLLYKMKGKGAKVLVIPSTNTHSADIKDQIAQITYYGMSSAVNRALNTQSTHYNSQILYGPENNEPIALGNNNSIDVADASLFADSEERSFLVGENQEECTVSTRDLLNAQSCQRFCRGQLIILRYAPPYNEWHIGQWKNRDADLDRQALEEFLSRQAVVEYRKEYLEHIKAMDEKNENTALRVGSFALPKAQQFVDIDPDSLESSDIVSFDHEKVQAQLATQETQRKEEAARRPPAVTQPPNTVQPATVPAPSQPQRTERRNGVQRFFQKLFNGNRNNSRSNNRRRP